MEELNFKYSQVKIAVNQVFDLVEQSVGVKRKKLKVNKSFYQDYGILGGDWDCFIEEFEKKFNQNFEGLEYERFFIEEGDFRNIFRKIKKERLTIGDIVLSVLNGKFTERKNTILNLIS